MENCGAVYEALLNFVGEYVNYEFCSRDPACKQETRLLPRVVEAKETLRKTLCPAATPVKVSYFQIWQIKNAKEDGAYWSNKDGWGLPGDVFSDKEKEHLNLPLYGQWIPYSQGIEERKAHPYWGEW